MASWPQSGTGVCRVTREVLGDHLDAPVPAVLAPHHLASPFSDLTAQIGPRQIIVDLFDHLVGIGEAREVLALAEKFKQLIGPLVQDESATGGNGKGAIGHLIAAGRSFPRLAHDTQVDLRSQERPNEFVAENLAPPDRSADGRGARVVPVLAPDAELDLRPLPRDLRQQLFLFRRPRPNVRYIAAVASVFARPHRNGPVEVRVEGELDVAGARNA